MNRVHLSLSWKLTALFALFGALISYTVIIVVGSQTSSAMVSASTSVLRSLASTLLPDRSNAAIEDSRSGLGASQAGPVRALPGQEDSGQGPGDLSGLEILSLLLKPAQGPGIWARASADKAGRLELSPLDPRASARVDALVHSPIPIHLPAFWGRRDRISYYADLSRPGDDWLLVAELSLDGNVAIAEFRKEEPLVILGILFWLGAALGLSQAFGRRLARPVRSLAEWSLDRTKTLEFRDLARGDEMGSLARSLLRMRNEIEDEGRELADRARALESMNRIDRAVLAGEARQIQLGKVLDAVLDYNPAEFAAIVSRDADGGGFAILAMAGASIDSGRPGGFVPDQDIPPGLIVRFRDPFEVDLAELGKAVEAFLPKLAPEALARLHFVNLPFASSGGEDGALVLIREGGADLARLGLLADQAGVALKDLDQRAASARNWLAVVTSLVRAVDAKSAWTKGHSDRVAVLSRALGRRLLMDGPELDRLEFSAVLHDVGKIGVPEAILDKPGRLTDEEMAIVRRHPGVGAGIVEDIPSASLVRSSILYHHERWDGSGYPEGLAGEAIPLGARIIALADVYDAITDERPYRRGMARDEARAFMASSAGTLFDPRLVRIFLELLEEGLPEGYRGKED